MDSKNKNVPKDRNTTQNTSYNPWNLLFSTRTRTESENSVTSNSSTSSGSQFGALQRQTSKNNEEYLWMIEVRKRNRQPPHCHSKTTRRSARNMTAQLRSLRVLSLLLVGVICDPAPGRIPKVYNALITSNQNLEPSKAYPVYQPVLQETFTFPFQPAVFYGGDFAFNNGIFPAPALSPKDAQPITGAPSSTPESITEPAAPSETPTTIAPETSSPEPVAPSSTSAPLPPNTQSPIPLNDFGLPPHVLPLGPAYDGFTQVGPFSYPYSGLRFYDPYDPFGYNPYANFPLYRPLTNILGSNLALPDEKPAGITGDSQPTEKSLQTPPPEPSDLNVLNYSSKDPAIPDVPPPPLPQGGLKSDKTE